MPRILSCFTNCYSGSGVWTAVERIRGAGIDHLELALRRHNFSSSQNRRPVPLVQKS
jgi:L-ribulose-5-phosphate 3-epimerase